MKYYEISACDIDTWDGFHSTFSTVFKFPDYYGRNMDAWNDCMSDLEKPVNIYIKNISELKRKNMEIYNAIIESSAFVNYRLKEHAVISLSFYDGDEYV
jgi:RNAse (barnase) inhibitor barstar